MNERRLYNVNQIVQIAGGVLSVILVLRLVKPDLYATSQMRVYRALARHAKRRAEIWTTVAAHADTAYMRLRNVTV